MNLDPTPWGAPRMLKGAKRLPRSRYASQTEAPQEVRWMPRPEYDQRPEQYPEWMTKEKP